MSLYHYAQPEGIAKDRRITVGQSSMAGASHWPKRVRCTCCEKMRNSETAIQTAYGYVCDFCSRGK